MELLPTIAWTQRCDIIEHPEAISIPGAAFHCSMVRDGGAALQLGIAMSNLG